MAVATPRKVINRRVRYETEYAAQKKEGHAFFPHAMFHDVVVNLLVVLIVVAMAVVWHATAQPISAAHPTGVAGWLGEYYQQAANPAVQQTEPRPDWYFLFLFELLRALKNPAELIFATIIIPTILMVLLVAWPFLDRGRDRRLSRRPKGVALALAVPAVLIALTMAGAAAPGVLSGSNISKIAAINALPGAKDISSAGCGTCHDFGTGGGTVGPNLANGASFPFLQTQPQLIAWLNGGANKRSKGVMPSYKGLGATTVAQIAQVLASLKAGKVVPLQK